MPLPPSTAPAPATAAPAMGRPAARSLSAGLSTLTGHARILALAGPAESGGTLLLIGSTPGGAIHVLVPPFARGAALSPVKVCSAAALAASVPFAYRVFTALSIERTTVPAISGFCAGGIPGRLSILLVEVLIAVRSPFSVLGIVFPGSTAAFPAMDVGVPIEIGRAVDVDIDAAVSPVASAPA